MPREQINPNSAIRLLETYNDFSGGLNSETSNERLKDNEFPTFVNVDLNGRGSARRRYGRTNPVFNPPVGTVQGAFFYFRDGQEKPDIVLAVSGQLYLVQGAPNPTVSWANLGASATWDSLNSQYTSWDAVNASLYYTSISITGLAGGFQTTRPIGATQYGTVLYIATGTKICQLSYGTATAWAVSTSYNVGETASANGNVYQCITAGISASSGTGPSGNTPNQNITDGTVTWNYLYSSGYSASVVTPYSPDSMEAVWIGLNGLSPNPSAYISDGTASSIAVAGIVPEYPGGGVSNETQTFTCYVNVPAGHTVDYQWQYKGPNDTSWVTGLAFAGTAGTNKTWTFTPNEGAGSYNISVQAKDLTGNTTSTVYYLMGYTVNQTLPAQPKDVSGIQTCNIIQLYWDRIILCGDTTNPSQMYISDLQNPAYFPTDNTIDWDTGKREPITALQMFRDSLFIFTPTTIQALEGQSTETYKKNLIHTEYGAVAGKSVQVVNNLILFLSHEGIMALQPNIYLTYYNIVRMDYPIRSEILGEIDVNASSAFWDNQYWLCIPSKSVIYRYHFDYKAWVKDSSSKLNLFDQIHHGEYFYNISQNGNVYQIDKTVYNDVGEIYTMQVGSKFFDFDLVFSPKKLKRVYILAKNYEDHNVDLSVTISADSAIVLNPAQGKASLDSNGNVIWTTSTQPNFTFYAGSTLGSWILGQSPLGSAQLSIQEAYITGSKARRAQILLEHSENSMCEVFGFAFQFRQKRLA